MLPQAALANYPIQILLLSFLVWRTLILIIAFASPGEGYDTSASLIRSPKNLAELPAGLGYLTERLTKWDAIYFVKIANRGYIHEQEWAFGWGFSRVIALCTRGEHTHDCVL